MEHRFRERALTRRLWAGTTVIAALCSHSSILLMSSVQPPIQVQAAPKAQCVRLQNVKTKHLTV
jgi:hypothetical protein